MAPPTPLGGMQSDTGDPLDWTVDQVVAFLCHNPETPWSQSTTGAPRPDPAALEPALRENLVTGEVLLHDVDKATLRDELGLKALGHRSSMFRAIEYLQQLSTKYQSSKRRLSIHDDRSNGSLSPFVSRPPSHFSPAPNNVMRDRTLVPTNTHITPIRPSNSLTTLRSDNIGAADASHTSLQSEEKPLVSTTNQERESRNSSHGPNSSPHHGGTGLDATRSGEEVVVDEQGRKRRRLNLVSSADIPQDQSKEWYMGPGQLTLSKVFYYSGKDKNPTSLEENKDDDSFLITGIKCPPAQRLVMNKRLKYFFKQDPIKLTATRGFSQWAVVPYNVSKVSSLPKDSPKLFTLYTFKGQNVTVSKEHIESFPKLANLLNISRSTAIADTEALNRSDPFSYLTQKYPVQKSDEDAYPLYGDSGSEGDFDEDTWKEIQEEQQASSSTKPKQLTRAEIDSTIEDCIHTYETEWNEKCRPMEEHKAYRLWQAAKWTKSRNQQKKDLERDNGFLHKRLQKFIDGIREQHWTTKSELQIQCQSIEQTVKNIQKQKWRLSVLELEAPPPQVPAPRRPQSKKKPASERNDEESLDSESDDMSSFIDNDDTSGGYRRTETTPSASGSDDIISPSGLIRRSNTRANPFRESSSPSPPSKRTPLSIKDIETIDLTAESPPPDDFIVKTPPLNPVGSTSRVFSEPLEDPFKIERSLSPGVALNSTLLASIPTQSTPPRHRQTSSTRPSDLPNIDDVGGLLSVPWEVLEQGRLRHLLLAKLIASLAEKERSSMAEEIPQLDLSDLKHLVGKAISALLNGKDYLDGMGPSKSQLVMRTASLYISWVNCVHLQLKGILKENIQKAHSEIHQFRRFFKELCTCLSNYRDSDKSDVSNYAQSRATETPHKKRKREVKESQEAKREQESGQKRAALQSKQKELFEKRMKRMGVSNTDPTRQAISFGNPPIYLNAFIGQYVKAHQLDGIQFMWRELMDEKQQGCLLAHTMGLGKTMQVISLLVTISECVSSRDPNIRNQVPETFRRSQTLILCPSALIENWDDEFKMWDARQAVGCVRKITTAVSLLERIKEVLRWNADGGVLIMSYDLFRSWVLNKETAKKKKLLNDEVHSRVKECLLNGPNIIVADEAHKMKNIKSSTSIAAMQFRSKSRIALTGSPLTNNLTDYHTMVEWIAEGFLPPFVEFKANYIEPIQEGLYLESTQRERRTSLVKLRVLNEILEPKIHRADITVLAAELPPKVEFVLTIPLTSLQKSAYNSYVENTLGQVREDSIGSTTLWGWLADLQLCCSHPSCFRDKIQGRANSAKSGQEEVTGDRPIDQAGVCRSDQLISDEERICDTVPDIRAVDLSYRTLLLKEIIEQSLQVGDKVLVFSRSLPTLDYLEYVLQESERKYCRLDGNTPVIGRQAATKRFNTDSEQEVYLISTCAGGIGLNILGANRVIIFDFSFSPFWEEQAVGRAYRLGQEKPVFVYRFISGGTFEEVLYNKALFKTQLSHRVVDKKNPIRQAAKSYGEWLFPVKSVPPTDISEFLGKDQVLDEILKKDNGAEKVIRRITLTATGEKDDNDKLTDEERRGVQEALNDERLRRTDPEAYSRLMLDRQREALRLLETQQQSMSMAQWSSSHLPFQMPPAVLQRINHYPAVQRIVPSSAHNTGPPPLAPDMSIFPQARGTLAAAQPSNQMAEFPRPPHTQNNTTGSSPGLPTGNSSNKTMMPSPGQSGFDGAADTEDVESDAESTDLSSDNECNPQ
ncbi:P-loop containing nucleoside triphosphate hydrolase protein [Aspergillus ambiguus]|uniref:putative SNF2 family helicase/ATPase n=1 Tax=Aspergillus ambiguus TaxID=176160 RepID=UPI003CCE314C